MLKPPTSRCFSLSVVLESMEKMLKVCQPSFLSSSLIHHDHSYKLWPWLLVMTGYFYGIIHCIYIYIIYITGISGHNCRIHPSRCLHRSRIGRPGSASRPPWSSCGRKRCPARCTTSSCRSSCRRDGRIWLWINTY